MAVSRLLKSCDPSRQSPDGFHFLGLAKLLQARSQRLLRLSALDRRRQDIGHRLKKMRVLLCEGFVALGIDAQNAPWLVLAMNDGGHSADDAVIEQ